MSGIPRLRLVDETRQISGSFKFRGALLGVRNSRRGVVACGSGNFPIAAGHAAASLGVPALLVMPDDTPARKQQLARGTGSETLPAPRGDFVRIAREAAVSRDWTALHPFQDASMLIGSSSLGLEMAEAIVEFGSPNDAVVVACGGGGLAAGVAIGLRLRGLPNRIYVVEPPTHSRLAAARAVGHPVEINPTGQTICDVLRATRIGDLAFAVMESCNVALTTASDSGVLLAQSLMAQKCAVFPEPSGALALAAVLEERIPAIHTQAWVVVCGGNL
ncbi:pyridoxal-phosphate dependent enzyme [Devosia sp. 1635]|uniref:pyridoxal-phosphate dependent enzyme n=1 Tax=Devosia sp. 1635 TaxID=2726066 RepID=UPI001563F688